MKSEKRCTLDKFKNLISTNRVVLFLKGKVSFPMCGLSGNVCSMLRKNGVDFIEINILEDPELYLLLKEECVSATAPYLFVEGKFIGGYDEIKLLFETEKLVGAVR